MKNKTMKQMDGTRRNHPVLDNPYTERQTCYVVNNVWILDVEKMIISL